MKASDRVQILVASSDAEACKAFGKVLKVKSQEGRTNPVNAFVMEVDDEV